MLRDGHSRTNIPFESCRLKCATVQTAEKKSRSIFTLFCTNACMGANSFCSSTKGTPSHIAAPIASECEMSALRIAAGGDDLARQVFLDVFLIHYIVTWPAFPASMKPVWRCGGLRRCMCLFALARRFCSPAARSGRISTSPTRRIQRLMTRARCQSKRPVRRWRAAQRNTSQAVRIFPVTGGRYFSRRR